MEIDADEVIEKDWLVANEAIVRDIVLELKDAYERCLNKPDRTVKFVDGLMVASNFARLVLEDIEARANINSIEDRLRFRRYWLNAVTSGMTHGLLS